MLVHLRRAVAVSIVLIVLCLVYTFVETGIGQLFFSYQANGSLIKEGNTVIASANIGQSWTGPKWFQGRDDPDNPASSGATNYGPRSEQLYEQVLQAEATLKKEGITPTNGLVTGSGSGIDPDISPADAMAQVNAVAKANNLPVSEVTDLVQKYSAPVYLGIFGSPYVNVLSLNMALAKLVAAKG
ncbi:MAG: K(+)-transporting ATPase subunit C [Acidimicrobiales bacterium]|jgi:K+-transporting ATPase ATPase C chain